YLIRAYGIRGGISHQSLAELVELNEKNLRKYLKELMNTILTSLLSVVAFNNCWELLNHQSINPSYHYYYY
ncbi:MAG: hypothetical protein ACRD5B_14045, partial [Nitrososphaeraceae archaeon]